MLSISILLTLLAAPSEMSAVQIHEFGGPEVLKVEQVAVPVPGDGELLVRVFAAGVNPVDWKMRQSGGRMGRQLPWIPGFDISGVVEAVGPNVTKFKAGDAVFGMLDLRRGGGYAHYTIVKESEAAAKPPNLSHIEAASVPLVALTAWQALFDQGHLERGQTVLIHGGSGGVGSMAVQLAKWKGAKVIATASTDNQDILKQLGADVAIDYKTQKFDDIAKGVDVVLDTVGGDTQARSWQALRKGGVLVSIVGPPSKQKADEVGATGKAMLVRVNADELNQIARLLESGELKAIVSHVFPLTDVAKAHEQSETGHTRGKIVLLVVKG